jgi:uncharacterized protein YciI
MKYLLPFITLFIFSCSSEERVDNTAEDTLTGSAYDSTIAARLGADDYGMKRYVMAFLKSGPNRNHDSITAVNLQRAHMNNIQRMAEEGSLIIAGPFLDDGDLRGIYIFNVESIEEARELTATDPAIQAGRLEMELHPWYGSAALQETLELHKKISKIK